MNEFAAPGTIIAGQYRVEKPIARGGFSTVYLGTQLNLGRPVALKLLDLRAEIEETWLARFEREARLASNLTHANTITIIDYGREDKFLFIVMEYIRGRSLHRQIRKYGALDPVQVAQIAYQVCLSLAEAHEHGILHRDLKPSNIMMSAEKEDAPIVKVLDFGVAKILEPQPDVDLTLTQKGVFVGTPRYAAPEQLVHEEVDGRTDVYGVGMVMWEALVGDPAVPELDYGACVEYHLSPNPWLLPDSIYCPSALANIVHKTLRKKPAERYQTIAELAADLETFVKQQDTTFDETITTLLQSSDPSEPSIDFSADEIFAGIGQPTKESDAPPMLAPTRREVSTQRLLLDPDHQPQVIDPNVDHDDDEPETGRRLIPGDDQEDEPKRKHIKTQRYHSEQSSRRTIPAPEEEEIELDHSKLPPSQPARVETEEIQQKVFRKKPKSTEWVKVFAAGSFLALFIVVVYFVATHNKRNDVPPPDVPAVAELTFGQEFLLTALKTTGWKLRVGDTIRYLEGVQQTQIAASKKGMRASMTVFEADSKTHIDKVIAQRDPGTMDVEFGTTLVRIRDNGNGAGAVFNTLSHLKEMGEKQQRSKE